MKIKQIKAREILDSRGSPTIEAALFDDEGKKAVASVPSGASTGKFEALELRDKDEKRFFGKGVLKAVENINKIIQSHIHGFILGDQEKFDKYLIDLDGTANKSSLGANAILAVSIAYAKLSAQNEHIPLYKYFAGIAGIKEVTKPPLLFMNMMNGGAHANSNLDWQEFQIIPKKDSVSENIRIGAEIYHTLKLDILKSFGRGSTNIGDEGGYVSPMKNNIEPFTFFQKVLEELGYLEDVSFGLDAAASEFWDGENYIFEAKKISKEELMEKYVYLVANYPFLNIEDPFREDDFESFAELNEKIGDKIWIMGDDLTVSNRSRVEMAEEKKACNAMIIKPNQIGSISEAIETIKTARSFGWKIIVSHRSGETTDDFLSDFAFGVQADGIKAGAPARGERVVKYNRMMEIEAMI